MLTRITKVKLGVFVAIAVVTLVVMALSYVRLPEQVGIGRYGVDVELAAAGGLYPQASVTYRGVEVGKVTKVSLANGSGDVLAHLEIDEGTDIPVESTAEVRSASVIGEQYVNFVPLAERKSDKLLAEGATVPVDRTRIPTTTDELLTSLDGFLTSIPLDDLRTAVDEAGAATNGVGDDLGQLISDSHDFQAAASENLPETIKLLEDAEPVLKTQAGLDPEIRSYAKSLSSVTGAVEGADAQMRGLVRTGAPFMREVGAFVNQLSPEVVAALTDLANFGQVLNVYVRHIEHVLIVLPAIITTVLSSVPIEKRGERSFANLWFKLGVDPPPCTTGFRDADKMRDPSIIAPMQNPSQNDWCKVPSKSDLAARGARNAPCPNGGRAATAEGCGLVFDKGAVKRSRHQAQASGGTPPNRGSVLAPSTDGGSFLSSGGAGAMTLTDLLKGLVN
ncbi:MCE family protein [Nocardioides sp. NPDC101246]|uniref:MCE family protein n=1 Tax=Nocardioides sp. NPDC101246 TaxID=3364336 RepID=UPI00382D92D5